MFEWMKWHSPEKISLSLLDDEEWNPPIDSSVWKKFSNSWGWRSWNRVRCHHMKFSGSDIAWSACSWCQDITFFWSPTIRRASSSNWQDGFWDRSRFLSKGFSQRRSLDHRAGTNSCNWMIPYSIHPLRMLHFQISWQGLRWTWNPRIPPHNSINKTVYLTYQFRSSWPPSPFWSVV